MKEIWKIVGEPDRLDWLIMAGWGNIDQRKIPSDVMRAAEEGRMPRVNGRKPAGRTPERAARDAARSARMAAKIAAMPMRNCALCGLDYKPNTIGPTATCNKRECKLEHRRRLKRGSYQRESIHYQPRMVTRAAFHAPQP